MDIGREYYFFERAEQLENVESVSNDFVLDIRRQDVEGLINVKDGLEGIGLGRDTGRTL
jgi:hypothetical protein